MQKKKSDVKRWWIYAIGYALAMGFINNLIIAPFTGQDLVDWGPLLTALGILLGISGARDYLTRNKNSEIPSHLSGKGWKRLWIPVVGWALFGGFFLNCALAPYVKIHINDWTQLVSTLTVMLGISGARDVGLMPKTEVTPENIEPEPDSESKIPEGARGGFVDG